MKYLVLVFMLFAACTEDPTPPTDGNDWDCSEVTSSSHQAFVECVTSMGMSTQQAYTPAQCEDYAHRTFCVSRKAKEAAQIKGLKGDLQAASKELAKTKKLTDKYHRQRNALCATLMGTCIMYGIATKADQNCEIACVIGDEDISIEVDEMIAADKKKKPTAEKED